MVCRFMDVKILSKPMSIYKNKTAWHNMLTPWNILEITACMFGGGEFSWWYCHFFFPDGPWAFCNILFPSKTHFTLIYREYSSVHSASSVAQSFWNHVQSTGVMMCDIQIIKKIWQLTRIHAIQLQNFARVEFNWSFDGTCYIIANLDRW